MLTFLPLEEIDAMDSWEGSQLNTAKEILAFELTKLVHGEEEANKAQAAAKAIFASGGVSADMPTTELTAEDFADGKIAVLDLMVKTGLAASKSEARRLVQQGGVLIGDEKVTATDAAVAQDAIPADGLIVKKGKKTFHRVVIA
jgi:tyrosyl-tRNA synthetase